MSKNSDPGLGDEGPGRHFTTRRWFVTAAGFAVVSLYLVWAGYEAAPTSLSFLTEAQAVEEGAMAHGGMGGGMTPDQFQAMTEAFIEKFSLPDGSVKPMRQAMPKMAGGTGHGDDGHADDDQAAPAAAGNGGDAQMDGQGMKAVRVPTGLSELVEAYRAFTRGDISAEAFDEVQRRAIAQLREVSARTTGDGRRPTEPQHAADEAAHDDDEPQNVMAEKAHNADEPQHAMAETPHDDAEPQLASAEAHDDGSAAAHDDAEPIAVYMMAMRYAYEPEVLRLEQDVPYRFRIMSMDANHGASVNVGFAGHIMRRPARQMAEMTMTFTETGEYLVYCTVYCGLGHDMMKGKIIVE